MCVCLSVHSGRSWELNVNSSKNGYSYRLQIWQTCSQGQSGHEPQKFSQKRAWPGSRDTLNFWVLNANNSETVKAEDFKFDTRVPRDSADMTRKNFPKRGRGQSHVTPYIFGR